MSLHLTPELRAHRAERKGRWVQSGQDHGQSRSHKHELESQWGLNLVLLTFTLVMRVFCTFWALCHRDKHTHLVQKCEIWWVILRRESNCRPNCCFTQMKWIPWSAAVCTCATKWLLLPFCFPNLPRILLVAFPNQKYTRKWIVGNVVYCSQADTL